MFMNNKKSINFGRIILFIFFGVLIFFMIRNFVIKSNIDESNKFVVAKFVSKERQPKNTNFWFTFFINGKRITTADSGVGYSILNTKAERKAIDDLVVNSFYLAKYSPENPNMIIVNPLKKVIDTTVILDSGFSKKDIED